MPPSSNALAPILKRLIMPTLFVVVLITVISGGDALARGFQNHAGHLSLHSASNTIDPNRPVLAFYYMWYSHADWCLCHMPDLPTVQYNSADDSTIDRQVTWAANAGITGFINSWWGPGDQTDSNFVKLLAHSATLEKKTGYHFASTIYFESDSPHLQGESSIVNALHYVISHYSQDSHFLRWHGKPIIFIWDPLGNGRTLSMWASVRQQVDPQNQLLWSAEGVSMSLLDVFDGIHLFSAGYWGILNGNMQAVDQGFRARVNAYNAAHHTQKIWAAGVLPGYDDTRIRGNNGFKVPRNNGATYHTSWDAALSSNPDWVTITSFNEWFEGSMIEPSVTYGNLYLTITQQYTKQWHG
jgi:Glycosyl hydrolase family 99